MNGVTYINDTDWRYDNSGTAALLCISGTTLTDLPETQSKSGTAFYQTARKKCFELPTTNEIWIKFDVYFDGVNRWRAYNEQSGYGSYGVASQTDGRLSFFAAGKSVYNASNACKASQLQTVFLHMHITSRYDNADGIIEAWVDGEKIYAYTGEISYQNPFRDIYLQSDGAGTFFSRVTIANYDFQNQLEQEKSVADLNRALAVEEKIFCDTTRLLNLNIVSVDTERQVKNVEKFSAETFREVYTSEKIINDTFRVIKSAKKIIVPLNRALREIISVDTSRQVTQVEKAVASTVIRIPYIWNYIVQNQLRTFKAPKMLADNQSLINTFKDYNITAVNITLSERTLSDDFRFEGARPIEINGSVYGNLLDYPFHFLVEEITQTDQLYSIKGMFNQDELLYTQFFLPTAEIDNQEEVIPISASNHMRNIANHLNLSADIKIDDFTPYNLSGNNRITYSDLLNSLFGWTSRLPQRQVNVFIRGKTLHCIQRGKESSVFDITDLPHSRPVINQKLIRSLWSNPKGDNENNDNDPSDDDPNIEYLYDDTPTPFTGTISFSDEGVSTTLKYSKGLLISERNEMANSKTTVSSSIEYEYTEIFPSNMSEISIFVQKSLNKNFYGDFYLKKKKMNNQSETINQSGTTIYRYNKTDGDDLYLVNETEETSTTTYEKNDKGVYEVVDTKSDIRETFHVPIGNGWYGQSVYLNGEAQGSNISQGKPGNKISQYTIAEVQKTFKGWKITTPINNTINNNDDDSESGDDGKKDTYDDWRRKLAPIMDISFPVREYEIIQELTNDLLWLNRKIEETVMVDLIPEVNNGIPSLNHIVDFTERIRFNGADYFLVSNRITFTSKKFIQKLQLIRWYKS